MGSDNHLILAYCHHGIVHEAFMQSVLSFVIEDSSARGVSKRTLAADNLYLPIGRNEIVKQFLSQSDADWLLFVDTDIIFTPDHVYDLFDRRDDTHQIISGLYFAWNQNIAGTTRLFPVWMNYEDGNFVTVENITGDLQIIDSCGMGFTLIGRKALLAIQAAHRDDPWAWFGHDLIDSKHFGMTRAGEDVTFCWRAKALGIKTWGFPTVVTHIKSHPENADTFAQWNSGIVKWK